ncbi:NACHT domain-containing protein [Stackebrandtia nassauensis]|uniref:Putative signal transduction protein with Nacht domain n=1 Tax=Stackebrandtia nassauensis (strain DSM 44728 / CIP 108903 / NRRL B-16338 / NBRC 102104 / LLR-40K-21) TaxID=446470 RepID=D3QAH8_STANL|nr:NACHT domain-containing protein [Stackebrandtia nassauensis]ADD42761.1 putative signal transduction protein with Nacht domain [Stackebrandtia nassauensis DSM 44728]
MSHGTKGFAVVALAALAVPAGVGGVLKNAVASNPLTAVLFLIIYWLLLAVAALVSTAARGPLQRRAAQLGDWVDAVLGRRFSRYARQYRHHMLSVNRWVDFKGLSIVGDHTPELDAVFVDVSVESAPVDRVPGGLVDGGTGTRDGSRHSIHKFLDGRKGGVLAVIGGPGCGKTTLLRHLARDTARDKTNRRRIPVFLALSRLSTPINDEPSLPQLLRIRPPELRVPEPKGWWEQQLHQGNCLVLMDGLDEVADNQDRRKVAEWIGDQVAAFPDNDFVITSRPGGYGQAPIEGARVLAVQPFSREQIERFLRGWYLATEREATGVDDSGVDAIAAEKANDLIDRLKDAPGLDELTANPLLLTMIALVHRYRSALPRGRADLYEEICRAMLWSRHEARGVTVALSGEAKWEVLAQLAFNLMKSRLREIKGSDVPPMIEDALEASLPGTESEQFLREVCGNGLLVEMERGVYAFAHQTIGEYLAAKHIIDCGIEDELVTFVDDVWWAETLELYAACARSIDKLVEACLRKGTEGAIAQAFTCANYGGRLERRLRDRLRRLEEQAFTPRADPAVRRAVARALVSRHLSRLKRLSDSDFYCPQPITEDLYWLFRCATGDGDTASRNPDGEHAVGGLWPADVKNFVDWINTIGRYSDRTDSPFRLPRRDEVELIRGSGGLDETASLQATAPIWRATARGPELPYTVTGEELIAAVTADIEETGLWIPARMALAANRVTAGAAPDLASYHDTLAPEFGWLPGDAAIFSETDSGWVNDLVDRLLSESDGEAASVFAEILAIRAGVWDTEGIATVVSSPSPAPRQSDGSADSASPLPWHDAASRSLADRARTAFARKPPPESPWLLRLPALLLAAEFNASRNDLNRDACLGIAATLTFRECRARDDYPGEALILVRD